MATWINDTSSGIVLNSFDKLMTPAYRLTYLIIRITLGTILGKEKRNRSLFFQRLHKGNYVNPTFLSKIYLYKFLRLFGSKKNTVEVYIKKFNYKIFALENVENHETFSFGINARFNRIMCMVYTT